MNNTNGGVEPWIKHPNRPGESTSFKMKMPHDTDDSDEEGPREITRENFGNTITKFNPTNTKNDTEIKKEQHDIVTGPPTAANLIRQED